MIDFKNTGAISSFTLCFANMLNPPLSLLSDDLFVSIVEQLAKLRSADAKLKNLSLADRAFTEFCQKYIFRKLILGKGSNIFKQLTKAKKSFDDNPSLANESAYLSLDSQAHARKHRFSRIGLYQHPPTARKVTNAATRTSPPWTTEFHHRGFHTRHANAWGVILFANLEHPPCQRMRGISIASFPHLPRVKRGGP